MVECQTLNLVVGDSISPRPTKDTNMKITKAGKGHIVIKNKETIGRNTCGSYIYKIRGWQGRLLALEEISLIVEDGWSLPSNKSHELSLYSSDAKILYGNDLIIKGLRRKSKSSPVRWITPNELIMISLDIL